MGLKRPYLPPSIEEKSIRCPERIPLEGILTVSAGDYCKSVGRELYDYYMVGIHVEAHKDFNNSGECLISEARGRNFAEFFAERIPKEAEVVVDYVPPVIVPNHIIASGTALIPKKI